MHASRYCDIEESRLEQIRQLGVAEQVFNTSGDGWNAQIQDGAFDAVMDFAGVPDMVTPMIHACKTRGRLLLVAGRFDVNYTFNVGQHKEISILQCSHFTRDDLENLCRFLRQDSVKIAPLIHHRVHVDEAPQIYRWLRDEPMHLVRHRVPMGITSDFAFLYNHKRTVSNNFGAVGNPYHRCQFQVSVRP